MRKSTKLLSLTIALTLLVNGGETRWIAVGSLHNWFSENGCESELGRTGSMTDQLDGLRYPAQDQYQDMQVSKGLWIGSSNYYDPLAGVTFPHKVVSIGPRTPISSTAIMPVEFMTVGRFAHPQIIVDNREAGFFHPTQTGANIIDPNAPSDRMLINTVHTSMGVTLTRKIYALSHPDHDNYMIYDYVFKNTGVIDALGTQHSQTLTDLMFFWLYRYGINREGGPYGTDGGWLPQNVGWGRNTMNEVMGENPESEDPFRAFYSWHGRHSLSADGHDNIGGPYYGADGDGHLSTRQFVGGVTLHADIGSNNQDDDQTQPVTTHYLGSDNPTTLATDQFNSIKMSAQYDVMSAGHPELSHAEEVGDGYADTWGFDAGGYSQTQGFGPYTLAPGDSVHIVLAEGVAGISRELSYSIGDTWLNHPAPYFLPDGSTTTNADEYKNAWVFTGIDSLMQTFQRATDNYTSEFQIPTPPPPPARFEIFNQGDKLGLLWANNAEDSPGFSGYRVFRSNNKYGFYDEVFACGINTGHPEIVNSFDDVDVSVDESYYYYIVSFDDGNTNNGSPLQSGEFWTRTREPAYITGVALVDADLYVSPEGSDNNDGLTVNTPFKTIQSALGRLLHNAIHQHTIFLAEGVYSPSGTGEYFPLRLNNFVSLQGAGSELTFLDAENLSLVIGVSGDSVVIKDLTLMRGYNNSPYTEGGGLQASDASLTISNVIIRDNSAVEGGGLYVSNTHLNLKSVSIRNNSALEMGGGLYLDHESDLTYDPLALSSIYSNEGPLGSDIATDEYYNIHRSIDLDTFTAISPSDYLVFPAGFFSLNSLNNVRDLAGSDLFVSPTGSDENSGLNSSEPLKTITHALKSILTTAETPQTIHLAEGLYASSSNGETFPIYPRDYLTISGESQTETHLKGENQRSLIRIIGHNNIILNHMSLRGSGNKAIDCSFSEMEFQNLLIEENDGYQGAGIHLGSNAHLTLSAVTIRFNTGNGLFIGYESEVVFDPIDRCNIYYNEGYTATGHDILGWLPELPPLEVFLDTCTSLIPNETVAYPLSQFTFDILNEFIPEGAHDFYVSPEGSDDNNGRTVGEPLQSITRALDLIYVDAEHPRNIYLENGIYSPSTTGEIFPLSGKNYVSIIGSDTEQTILDGDSLSAIFEMSGIQNIVLEKMTIQKGSAIRGGVMTLAWSSPTFKQIIFKENRCQNGGGVIYLGQSDELNTSKPLFVNCTFVNNSSESGYGGVLQFLSDAHPVFINSLVWENGSIPIISSPPGQTTMVNTLIEGGSSSALTAVEWIGSIIDSDPLFVGGNPYSLELTSSSPAINAGVAQVVFEDTLINLSADEYIGGAPDIGALESPYTVGIDPMDGHPQHYRLYPNYPNPFNPTTTISFDIPNRAQVDLSIFDLRGRQIWISPKQMHNPGRYSIVWGGRDSQNLLVESGVYLVQLQSETFRETQKILLIR